MKKMRINVELVFRMMIILFMICVCGVFMQIISPEFPEHATMIGILFFLMAFVLGIVIMKFRHVVRRARIAAAREQDRQELVH